MLSLALAVAVITAPPDAAVDVPCSLSSLQTVAVSLELMDVRERRYVCMNTADTACDVRLLRSRYAELQDAPPASDVKRFPDREGLNEQISFNRLYKVFLEDRFPLTREDWIPTAIEECDWCYRAYDYARDARCGYYYITVRRQALQKLREAIGFESYYAGCMPPPIPTVYLRRVD